MFIVSMRKPLPGTLRTQNFRIQFSFTRHRNLATEQLLGPFGDGRNPKASFGPAFAFVCLKSLPDLIR